MSTRIKTTISKLLADAMRDLQTAEMPDELNELAAWMMEQGGNCGQQLASRKHSHYFKDVSHLNEVDVYRVLKLFNVSDPCLQHGIKKLLVAGGRGAGKNIEQDLREAVDSIHRALQMIAEDAGSKNDSGFALPPASDAQSTLAMLSAAEKQVQKLLLTAQRRIFDLLIGDDPQASKEARKFLEQTNPPLYQELLKHQWYKET